MKSSMWLGAMTTLLGAAMSVQAATSPAPSSTKGVDRSKQAARLLRDIRVDAVAVRSSALHINKMAETAGATWIDYDREWNEIDPSVEDMQMKLARLETMQSALSPAERTEVDQVKPLVGEIQARTGQFLMLLDTPGVQTSDMKFKVYAQSIRSEADKLEKVVPAA